MLELQMKQHCLIIDTIETDAQNSMSNQQLHARDQVLHRMQEQIRIRDNLLNQAEKHFTENKVDVHLDDPKLMNYDELVKINSSIPKISNISTNPYGMDPEPRSQLSIIKSKYKSKLATNSSLPPIPKAKESEQPSFMQRRNPYQSKQYGNPYNRGKIIGKMGISQANRNPRLNMNSSSIHSQMRKNKHTFSTPAMKMKKRYGHKLKTAVARDNSVTKFSPNNKPYGIPKTGVRHGIHIRNEIGRRLRSPEERKIVDSVRSNDESIISTASSNDGGKKGKSDPSLQVAGQPLTLRKGGGRFERTPFSRKPRNNLRNIAQQNFSVDQRINKFKKKELLANLNRQYRNKYL